MPFVQSQDLAALFDALLDDPCYILSPEEILLIRENRESSIHKLLPVLQQEVKNLFSEDQESNYTHLAWSLRILCDLKESTQTFNYLKKLWYMDSFNAEGLDREFHGDFAFEYLQYMLANTAYDRWPELIELIEKSPHHSYTTACFEALTILVARNQIPREEIVRYFHSLFPKIFSGEIYEIDFISDLVFTCLHIGPKEWEEDIRELIACHLAYGEVASLNAALAQDTDACLADILSLADAFSFYPRIEYSDEGEINDDTEEPLDTDAPSDEEDLFLHNLFTNTSFIKAERNDPCPCNSGKKYKKCCVNKSEDDPLPLTTRKLQEDKKKIISRGYDRKTEEFLESESKAFAQIDKGYATDPENTLSLVQNLMLKHPHILLLHELVAEIYTNMKKTLEAAQFIKDTYHNHPHSLWARTAYAQHLMRRGEWKKIPEIFSYAFTLNELFPEQECFELQHALDFYELLALYYAYESKQQETKTYLKILKDLGLKQERLAKIQWIFTINSLMSEDSV